MMAKAGSEANHDSPHWSKFHRDKMNELMDGGASSDSDGDEDEDEN